MSTEGGSGSPTYKILPTPPPEGTEGPRLEEVPPDEEVEYVIEDLETAESPTGGAAIRCHGCYCTGW